MLDYSSLTLSDALKYWASVIAISVVIVLYSGRISGGVIFLIAGAAMFGYWALKSARRKSEAGKHRPGP